MTIWIYIFEDGTKLELLNIGFSTLEIIALRKLHGKVVINSKRMIGDQK